MDNLYSHFHATLEFVEIWIRIGTEVIVGAFFHYLTFMNDEHPLAVSDSAQSVSNDYRCSSLHCPVQSLLDYLLTVFVKSTSGFVEDEDLGILNKSSSNSYSLLLTSRQHWSSQTTLLVESLMQNKVSFVLLLNHRVLHLLQSLVFCLLHSILIC